MREVIKYWEERGWLDLYPSYLDTISSFSKMFSTN